MILNSNTNLVLLPHARPNRCYGLWSALCLARNLIHCRPERLAFHLSGMRHQITAAGKAFTAENADMSFGHAFLPNVASIIFDRAEVTAIAAMLEALRSET